jgi:hypothetical protein
MTVKAVAVLLAVVAVVLVGSAGPAAAGNGRPPCGSDCDHTDPNYFPVPYNGSWYNCSSDARSQLTNWAVTLRYSPHCETTWAQADPLCSCMVLTLWVESYTSSSGGSPRTTDSTLLSENSDDTNQLNDHNLYNRACMTYSIDTGNTWQTICTGRY